MFLELLNQLSCTQSPIFFQPVNHLLTNPILGAAYWNTSPLLALTFMDRWILLNLTMEKSNANSYENTKYEYENSNA
jgi:hypothetical protein